MGASAVDFYINADSDHVSFPHFLGSDLTISHNRVVFKRIRAKEMKETKKGGSPNLLKCFF